ncbi:MAG: hypothetical protein Q9212_005085 [Teloschistes hypoglaucus]
MAIRGAKNHLLQQRRRYGDDYSLLVADDPYILTSLHPKKVVFRFGSLWPYQSNYKTAWNTITGISNFYSDDPDRAGSVACSVADRSISHKKSLALPQHDWTGNSAEVHLVSSDEWDIWLVNGSFQSKVFEIHVGSSAEPFFAHADILSKSKVLRKEVEGLWKEKLERKNYWPDWSVNAADKFLEWLYTADYTCPYPVEPIVPHKDGEAYDHNSADLRSSSNDALVNSSGGNVRSGSRYESSNISLDNTGGRGIWGGAAAGTTSDDAAIEEMSEVKVIGASKVLALRDLNWLGCHALDKTSQAEEYEKWTGRVQWTSAELDYGSTFMTHAEVYVMACRYMIDDLKNMAWQRLRSVLISIGTPQLGSAVVGDLVTLIHYVYQETAPRDVDDNEEPLRELVVTFMALNFKQLKGSAVDDLVRPRADVGGELVADLMNKLIHRIESLEAQIPPSTRSNKKAKKGIPSQFGWSSLTTPENGRRHIRSDTYRT